MAVCQVKVHPAKKRPAVTVAKPAGRCGHIHAAFNAARGEHVAEVVVTQTGQARPLAGRGQ